MYAYELPPPTSVGPGSEVSGDEERSSISSNKSSTQRDAAQTFTTIQRTVRPGNTFSKLFNFKFLLHIITILFTYCSIRKAFSFLKI